MNHLIVLNNALNFLRIILNLHYRLPHLAITPVNALPRTRVSTVASPWTPVNGRPAPTEERAKTNTTKRKMRGRLSATAPNGGRETTVTRPRKYPLSEKVALSENLRPFTFFGFE